MSRRWPTLPLSVEEKWHLAALVVKTLFDHTITEDRLPHPSEFVPILECALKMVRKKPQKWLGVSLEIDAYIRAHHLGGPKAVLCACERLVREAPHRYGNAPEALKTRYYEDKRQYEKVFPK